jgi:hypothetical protein
LDGRHSQVDGFIDIGNESSDELFGILCSLDPLFKDAMHGWAVWSADGRRVAVVLRLVTQGWFSRRTGYIGVVLYAGDRPRILGNGVMGSRDSSGEFHVRTTLEFS